MIVFPPWYFRCHGSAVVLPADDLADCTLKNGIIHSTKLPKDDIAENSNDNCLNLKFKIFLLTTTTSYKQVRS